MRVYVKITSDYEKIIDHIIFGYSIIDESARFVESSHLLLNNIHNKMRMDHYLSKPVMPEDLEKIALAMETAARNNNLDELNRLKPKFMSCYRKVQNAILKRPV